MAQILKFPTKKIEPVTVRSRLKHRIAVEILDDAMARRIRWAVQFEIEEVAGFGALDGFTDAAVASGYRHRFWISGSGKVRQFVAETAGFVATGQIAVWIDGVKVQPKIKRSA